MKIKVNGLLARFILIYPILYSFLMLISDSLSRKVALLFLVLIVFHMLLSCKKRNFITLTIIFLLVLLNAIRFGFSYIIHQDFYGYILLLLVFSYYTDASNIKRLEVELIKEKKSVRTIVLFFATILFSIIEGQGLRKSSEWGVSMPMLYGPYGLPHSLAYQILLIYLLASTLYHKSKKKKYLMVMAIACISVVWTGVRSAFLALTILILCDYNSIKRPSLKALLLVSGGLVFVYLLLFTDIIKNNPIVQKTLTALSKGSISNSRDDFNNYLSGIFKNSMNFFEKLFGIGMQQLRKTMYLRYATELHAHNDVMNTLVGMGVVGFSLFLYYFFSFCRRTKKGLWVFLILMSLAYTNGLYMYIAFTPCIPIVLIYGDYVDK